MEEFFREGTIPEHHLITALHEAIREDRIFPVLYASGLRNVGTDHLLDFLKVYAPAPIEREPVAARGILASPAAHGSASNGEADSLPEGIQEEIVMRRVDDAEPLALYIYKTMTDPFAGRISFFKVVSGMVKTDATVQNFTRQEPERLAHLSIMQGRKAVEVPELHAGDLGAVAKLRVTLTGDTLGDKAHEIFIEPVAMPEPAMTYAIEPKTRADEDKLAPALHKLMEEDQMVRFFRDPQTNEFLVAGAGQPHIEAIVSKLKRRYHTEVTLKAPKVPYRETIRSRAEAQGRHKKQTGGHGQFGDCKIRMEPLPRGSGIVFVNEIFGGAIPRQYVPAVEKGIHESAARGYLAGYPVVDFKVSLFDGSYHDVDSSEMSFKLAARAAFRKCMELAKPALAGAGHARRDRGAGRVRRRADRRPEQPPRPRSGHGKRRRRNHRPRRSAHGRDADLRHHADLHDPGPRQLPYGDGPLRRRPATGGRKDSGHGESSGPRRSGRLIYAIPIALYAICCTVDGSGSDSPDLFVNGVLFRWGCFGSFSAMK